MKRTGRIIFLFIFIFMMCASATFAWNVYRGADINVSVNFSSIDKYINYTTTVDQNGNEGGLTPSESPDTGVKENIVFQKKDIAVNLDLLGHMYLKVGECTTNDCTNYNKLFESTSLSWSLVDNNDNTISEGNFVGEVVGNEIPINVNFDLDTDTTYDLFVWIDSSENNNVDISGLSLETSMISESKRKN